MMIRLLMMRMRFISMYMVLMMTMMMDYDDCPLLFDDDDEHDD